jgi:hypothetical protein
LAICSSRSDSPRSAPGDTPARRYGVAPLLKRECEAEPVLPPRPYAGHLAQESPCGGGSSSLGALFCCTVCRTRTNARHRRSRTYLGAFGTGRVSPRSAGKRSSFGAWPVVVPAFGGSAVFGASRSAGWCGSFVGGGGASILIPSPSIRGAGAFCAAATLALKSSAAKARERFLIRCILALTSPLEKRDALIQVPGRPSLESCTSTALTTGRRRRTCALPARANRKLNLKSQHGIRTPAEISFHQPARFAHRDQSQNPLTDVCCRRPGARGRGSWTAVVDRGPAQIVLSTCSSTFALFPAKLGL